MSSFSQEHKLVGTAHWEFIDPIEAQNALSSLEADPIFEPENATLSIEIIGNKHLLKIRSEEFTTPEDFYRWLDVANEEITETGGSFKRCNFFIFKLERKRDLAIQKKLRDGELLLAIPA